MKKRMHKVNQKEIVESLSGMSHFGSRQTTDARVRRFKGWASVCFHMLACVQQYSLLGCALPPSERSGTYCLWPRDVLLWIVLELSSVICLGPAIDKDLLLCTNMQVRNKTQQTTSAHSSWVKSSLVQTSSYVALCFCKTLTLTTDKTWRGVLQDVGWCNVWTKSKEMDLGFLCTDFLRLLWGLRRRWLCLNVWVLLTLQTGLSPPLAGSFCLLVWTTKDKIITAQWENGEKDDIKTSMRDVGENMQKCFQVRMKKAKCCRFRVSGRA